MGAITRTLLICFLAWLAVRIYFINKNLRILGFGVPVFNHAPGPCKIFHVNGSEDIDVLPNGIAIISSGLKFRLHPGPLDPAMHDRRGILYTFDFNNPEQKPKPLTLENFDDSNFNPHGIDLFVDPQSQKILLFVVNHNERHESIEIFNVDQENMVLKHRKTVVDDKIQSPNDVVAVGPDSFYITNDRYFKNPIVNLIENLYGLKWGTVAFYNGASANIAANNFAFANGITVDSSGKYIVVASGMEGELVILERKDKKLIERQRIYIGSPTDNVVFDDDGHIWVGTSHFDYLEYSTNFSKPMAGKVFQVLLSKEDTVKYPFKVNDIREVFATDGRGELKGVSVAQFYRGKVLIGNPFGNLMYCEVLTV